MRKISYHAVAFACALAAGTAAQAATVEVTGFAYGSETVNFSLTAPNVVVSGSAPAGGMNTTVDGGPSFVSYCLDLYQAIAFNTPYPEYTAPTPGLVFSASVYENLGHLYATAGTVNDSVESAAFQIAAWEIAYEAGGYDLATGSAIFSGGTADTSGALALAQTWLDGLSDTDVTVLMLQSDQHQDVITTIPEPETYALMLAGIAAVGFVARRRQRPQAGRASA